MNTAAATQTTTVRAFDWELDWPEDDAPAELGAHYDAIAARILAGHLDGLATEGEMSGEFWGAGQHCPLLPPVAPEDGWDGDDDEEGDDDGEPYGDGLADWQWQSMVLDFRCFR